MSYCDEKFIDVMIYIMDNYVIGEDTIKDVMKRYNKSVRNIKTLKSREDKIDNINCRLEVLSNILMVINNPLKGREKNIKDMLVVTDEMKTQIEKLEKIAKEEK